MKMRSERIALDKLYKRRDRYEIPDWQREKVWSATQQRKLIDSILRGWKLPKFYFQKTSESPDTFEVVDGQQRLTAIWGFFDGDVELDSASLPTFGARTYQDLPDKLSDQFDDYELEFDLITDSDDEDVKEFFQRLQAGLPLTSSEKLNSIHSKLRDYCAKLAQHDFFSTSTRVPNRRHGYFDICTKVLTIEIEGIDAGLRYDDVKAVFAANTSFSASSAVAKRCKASLDLLLKVFPEPTSALRQRSMVQSVITLVAHLRIAGLPDSQAPKIAAFLESFSAELLKQVELGQSATDPVYLAFQRTVNANTKAGARIRHTILLSKLFASHPSIFSTMSKTSELDASLKSGIERDVAETRDLIKNINDAYAAKNGGDLFKLTNKTVPAITSMQVILTSFEDYKSWVDNLYFYIP